MAVDTERSLKEALFPFSDLRKMCCCVVSKLCHTHYGQGQTQPTPEPRRFKRKLRHRGKRPGRLETLVVVLANEVEELAPLRVSEGPGDSLSFSEERCCIAHKQSLPANGCGAPE